MKILITQELPFDVENYLKNHELIYNKSSDQMTREDFLENISTADAAITMLSDKVDKQLIDAGKNLKVIANYAVGYNNIDVKYADEKGIVVCNTPDVLTETTAELGFALIISTARRIVEAHKFVENGEFVGWKPSLMLGLDLYGKTLGIFGFGKIGQALSRCSKGFNMNIIYHSRNRNIQGEILTGARYSDFETLIKESDFLVVTAPLTDETKYKFTLSEFKKMKNSAIFVNIGRGPIVREEDLFIALKKGFIAGAGLDVFEEEPKIYEGLFELPNVIMLPHIGSASTETRMAMAKLCCDSLLSVIENNRKPANAIN